MPTKNLSKVQKSVTKKKGRGAPLHQHSRDAKRISQASRRQDKLAALASKTDSSHKPYLERALYLQQSCEPPKDGLPEDIFRQLVENFIERNDPVLSDLESSRRSGRPPSAQEVRLEQKQRVERTEYASGFWVPDLRCTETVRLLHNWNGEWAALSELEFCRVPKDGAIQRSGFPPKGGH